MRWWLLGTIGLALACSGEEAATETTPETVETEPDQHSGEHAHQEASGAAFQPLTDARVMFANLEDGATVSGPLVDGKVSVHVEMGAEGVEIRPAGTIEPNTGHHHIIVDGEGVPLETVVPANDNHIHFGGGQTETDVMLTPGEHTLMLQLGDHAHRSYGPDLTARISITVEATEGEGEATE